MGRGRGRATPTRGSRNLIAPSDGPVRAGGIAILGFLAGLALSTVIGVVLLLAGVDIHDPWLLVASTAGLWVGLVGACWIAVRRKGTGSLRDLGLDRFRPVDARDRCRRGCRARRSWPGSSA